MDDSNSFALSEDEAASPSLTDKHLAAFKGTYYSIALGNPQAGDFNVSTYDDLLTQLGAVVTQHRTRRRSRCADCDLG